MKKIIVALTMCLMLGGVATAEQQINPRVEQRLQELIDEKFSNIILITIKECSSFGVGWKTYGPIAGRFPLAAGRGTDEREKKRSFVPGDIGGEYKHQLTVPEMPAHDHSYQDTHGRGIRADYGDDEPSKLHNNKRKTEQRGGGKAHNNMPPYLALNFCYKP